MSRVVLRKLVNKSQNFGKSFSSSCNLLQSKMAKNVGESYNFPKEEEKVLELWKEIDAFKTSLKLSEGKPRYDSKKLILFSKFITIYYY